MTTVPDIKTGDFVEIPKGTTYYDTYYNPVAKLTTRKTIARAVVSEVATYWKDGVQVTFRGTGVTEVHVGWHVSWADKYTDINNVVKVDPPKEKEVSKEPTFRQRLAPKTAWKVTNLFPVYSTKVVQHTNTNHTWNSRELDLLGDLPIGTEFIIIDKASTGYPGVYSDDAKGVWYPVMFTSEAEVGGRTVKDKKSWLRLSDINGNLEQVGEAEPVPVFVIWDTAKQAYYSGWDNGWDYTNHVSKDSSVLYDTKLTKAKKFNRLNDARVHALVQSGYYNDLPVFWGEVPDWMCSSKAFDIPDTWEIVKIDKLTKNVMERIDLVTTFKRTWKLRALTIKYGSAVRAVYSDLEKKNKLGEYQAMMVFTKNTDKASSWDYQLTDDEKADIKDMADRFDKKDIKAHKSNVGYAAAVKDIDTAIMVKLMYSGTLTCSLIDFAKMDEAVEAGNLENK